MGDAAEQAAPAARAGAARTLESSCQHCVATAKLRQPRLSRGGDASITNSASPRRRPPITQDVAPRIRREFEKTSLKRQRERRLRSPHAYCRSGVAVRRLRNSSQIPKSLRDRAQQFSRARHESKSTPPVPHHPSRRRFCAGGRGRRTRPSRGRRPCWRCRSSSTRRATPTSGRSRRPRRRRRRRRPPSPHARRPRWARPRGRRRRRRRRRRRARIRRLRRRARRRRCRRRRRRRAAPGRPAPAAAAPVEAPADARRPSRWTSRRTRR